MILILHELILLNGKNFHEIYCPQRDPIFSKLYKDFMFGGIVLPRTLREMPGNIIIFTLKKDTIPSAFP